MRQWMIKRGILEAIIGLPPALFYGTGIPASILVINKAGAQDRKNVLFINADREFKEGKVQNILRPEDIEKVTHTYRTKQQIDNYSKLVSAEELEKEDFNCNIRRYVDNSPPAEPHDVNAHLHGGIPLTEVAAMGNYWKNYAGLRERLFTHDKPGYLRYTAAIRNKEDIRLLLDVSPEIIDRKTGFSGILEAWWKHHLIDFEALPAKKNIYDLYHKFSATITTSLSALGILDEFQSRGAFASYWNAIDTDLRSVAASGWNAELIPDEEILESQFPEVLKELRQNEARRDELEALFKEVNAQEEGVWSEEDYEVWPKDELAEVKANIKILGGELKEIQRDLKNKEKQLTATKKTFLPTANLETEIASLEARSQSLLEEIEQEEKRTARHVELEAELKQCKKKIKEIKDRKEELVEKARSKIDATEARRLILDLWNRTLHTTVDEHLEHYQLNLRSALENLWDKYDQPLNKILQVRESANVELVAYLKELGYE